VQYAADPDGKTEPVGAQASGLSVSYSPEYKNLEPNNFLLNHLKASSLAPEGVTLPGLFTQQRKPQRRLEDAWELFTLIALCLWLLDVATRRLVIDWREWRVAAAAALEGTAGQRARTARESLAGLLAVKTRAGRHAARPAEQVAYTERRERLQHEAQARERAGGQAPAESANAPAGEISAPQRTKPAPQGESLAKLRQRLAERDAQRSDLLRGGVKPGPPAAGAGSRASQAPAESDLSTREVTKRLLKRKKHHRARGDDEDGS
jgi:hypothetical protein